ncbi:hypothetical protein C2E23DRAFT_720686 [Lenzites betulinus]|nr:hypothetical protein C2E23DRAFT_720686 [Lenzites betulinus]
MPRRTTFASPSARTSSGSPSKQKGAVGTLSNFQHPPGSASLFGIAVLDSPRLADPSKPRTITYDASFWMGDGSMPLMACFRYFNRDNAEIPDNGTFALMATVAQPTEDAELCTDGKYTDYDLIGDILWMAYVPDADARRRPVMTVNGPAREINREDASAASFKITANQFVQQLKDANPGQLSVIIEIPDSGRFKNGRKPLPPNEGSNAAVIGQLTSVERTAPTMAAVMFCLSMENVTYFPRSHTSLPVHHPSTPDSNSSKRKWAFEDPLTTPLNPAKRRASASSDSSPEGGSQGVTA